MILTWVKPNKLVVVWRLQKWSSTIYFLSEAGILCKYLINKIHIITFPEPDSKELQEAVSKDTFQHEFNNLEPATTYSIYLKAYSPLGASQKSNTVIATTLGGGKSSHIMLIPQHSKSMRMR